MKRNNELYHYGIKGQQWGLRRYQNEDGTLTAAGKIRYNRYNDRAESYDVNREKRLKQLYSDHQALRGNDVRALEDRANKASKRGDWNKAGQMLKRASDIQTGNAYSADVYRPGESELADDVITVGKDVVKLARDIKVEEVKIKNTMVEELIDNWVTGAKSIVSSTVKGIDKAKNLVSNLFGKVFGKK